MNANVRTGTQVRIASVSISLSEGNEPNVVGYLDESLAEEEGEASCFE